ncbi:MAG: 4Fe-4S dicluster domain-containing protein [bacterium]
MKKAMLIDTSKCTGCRGCQIACKQWNQLPAEKTYCSGTYENPSHITGNTWTKIAFIENENNGDFKWFFYKQQCMQCEEASCVNVCPAKAVKETQIGSTYIDEAILIDKNICVGCKNCVVACPFQFCGFSEEKGIVMKCTFCIDRVLQGLKPACIKSCISGALQFEDRDKILDIGKKRIEILKTNGYLNACLYGENELGGLGVISVLLDSPEKFRLPVNPKSATENSLKKWFFGLGTVAIMTILPFWLLFKKTKENSQTKEEGGN